jgi:site-specific recombinase XerC
MDCIAALRASGVSAISVNTYLRGLKACCRWLVAEGHMDAKDAPRVTFLKTEQKVLATLTAEHVASLVAFHPQGVNATARTSPRV